MTKITQLTKEELEPVVNARAKAVDAAQKAEAALKDAKLAEYEFKISSQQLYLTNGLEPNCQVNLLDGSVKWPEPEVTEEVVEKKKRGRKAAVTETEPDTEV
jgi:hypothetical protein